MEDQAKAFETQVPHAQLVRIVNADHYIFQRTKLKPVQDVRKLLSDSVDSALALSGIDAAG
jgi:hypothetical protein